MQAISETIYWGNYGLFRYRRKNHKFNTRKFDKKESCMQEHLYRDFSSPDHTGFLNDVSVTLVDKTDESETQKRENYLMNSLKTIAPPGLNIEDSV